MARTINEVTLYGNVGKDPEVKTLSDGQTKVATFSLATSTGGYKSKDGKDIPEVTQWHNIVAWRGLAGIAESYIHKGDKVIVRGSIAYRNYDNKEGQKVYVTEIVASDLSLTGGKHEGGSQAVAPTSIQMPTPPPAPNTEPDDLPF